MNILRTFAETYVAGLRAGDKILMEVDWQMVKPIFHLLPGLLWTRGLRLERIGLEGWVVMGAKAEPTNPFSDFGDDEHTRIQCGGCRGDWFRCGCPSVLTVVEGDVKVTSNYGGAA